MDSINVPVFAQAKIEYTKQLTDILYIHIFDGFTSIYNESKKIYITKTGVPILNIFRKLLENIPIWNNEIIEEETKRIIKVSKCDWLDDLVTAVFISHTRILMSIGPNQNTNKINVSIPKTPNFIHKIYINIARDLWKNPYLYNENVAGHDRQRNMNRVEEIIKINIETTIRKELPVKEILRGHLDTYENNEKLDIQMILNEIKKNNINTENITKTNEENEENEENEDFMEDNSYSNDNEENNFIEENNKDIPEEINDNSFKIEKYDNVDIFEENKQEELHSSLTDNIYNDPNDPSIDDIKKNIENIVVNDITIPVEEPKIETPTKNTPETKDITTVNKIDDKDVKMFSFNSLYPGMKTFGSVTKEEDKEEDKTPYNPLGSIGENYTIKEENIDKTIENISQNNDIILKEIMKIDKKEENIDETETLDNFFNDVKKMASENDKNINVDEKETSYTFFD